MCTRHQCAHGTNDLVCYVGLKITEWWVEYVALCINPYPANVENMVNS